MQSLGELPQAERSFGLRGVAGAHSDPLLHRRTEAEETDLPLLFDKDERMAEMVSDSRLDLHQAMGRLRPKYRHVLVLKYYQDMTLAEIANVLDKPEGTVKTWLHQGLKQLRGKLNAGGEVYHGE